jgi:hypothetical protein
MRWKDDGTRFYYYTNDTNELVQITLDGRPWQWLNGGWTEERITGAEGTGAYGNPSGFEFVNDGAEIFIADRGNNQIGKTPLDTPWDLKSAQWSSTEYWNSAGNREAGVTIGANGLDAYYGDQWDEEIVHFKMSEPFDITTASEEYSLGKNYNFLDVNVYDGGRRLAFVGFDSDIHSIYMNQEYELRYVNLPQDERSLNPGDKPNDTDWGGVDFDTSYSKMFTMGHSDGGLGTWKQDSAGSPNFGYEPTPYEIATGWSFNEWFQMADEHIYLIWFQATVETDGTTDGLVELDLDYSGGTTAQKSFTVAQAPAALGAGATVTDNIVTFIPPGWHWQFANTQDPNGNNAIDESNSIAWEF